MKPMMLLCLGLGLATGLPVAQAGEQVWSGHFALPAGGRLAVENVQGEVLVEGWERPEVEVTVAKTTAGAADRLSDVRIGVEFGDRTLTLRTLYPDELDEPVRVDYRLRVPRQIRLERLSTLEGDISVRDVEGIVDARSLHGDIRQVNVAGAVAARTLTGNIEVSLRALPEGHVPLVLEAMNGNVALLLPPQPNADLELSTVAGRVEGNYVFETSAVPGDNVLRARLGRGGVRVSVRTVRGDIRVAERTDRL